MNLCAAGDNIVSSTDLYGGTWNLFANTLKQFGVEVRFVDPADPEGFARATDARTRCYYAETLPNPKLQVFPIAEVAAIGRKLGVPLIMDNTAAPILCKPLALGAAVVMHSHHQIHRRAWHQHRRHRGRWRQFRLGGRWRPLPHAEQPGPELPWRRLVRRRPSRSAPSPISCACATCLCATSAPPMSPFNAFMFLQGLETLPLRMERHCANALKVAAYLAAHPEVTRVIHPSAADRREPSAAPMRR